MEGIYLGLFALDKVEEREGDKKKKGNKK